VRGMKISTLQKITFFSQFLRSQIYHIVDSRNVSIGTVVRELLARG
jgi:hypothetical protein